MSSCQRATSRYQASPGDARDHDDSGQDHQRAACACRCGCRPGGGAVGIDFGGHGVGALVGGSLAVVRSVARSRARRHRDQTAAERAIEVDGRVQALRAQRGELLVELQQRALRGEHVELRAEAGAIALRGERRTRLCEHRVRARSKRSARRASARSAPHRRLRAPHRPASGCSRRRRGRIGIGLREIAAQAAAVEDRQAQRRDRRRRAAASLENRSDRWPEARPASAVRLTRRIERGLRSRGCRRRRLPRASARRRRRGDGRAVRSAARRARRATGACSNAGGAIVAAAIRVPCRAVRRARCARDPTVVLRGLRSAAAALAGALRRWRNCNWLSRPAFTRWRPSCSSLSARSCFGDARRRARRTPAPAIT